MIGERRLQKQIISSLKKVVFCFCMFVQVAAERREPRLPVSLLPLETNDPMFPRFLAQQLAYMEKVISRMEKSDDYSMFYTDKDPLVLLRETVEGGGWSGGAADANSRGEGGDEPMTCGWLSPRRSPEPRKTTSPLSTLHNAHVEVEGRDAIVRSGVGVGGVGVAANAKAKVDVMEMEGGQEGGFQQQELLKKRDRSGASEDTYAERMVLGRESGEVGSDGSGGGGGRNSSRKRQRAGTPDATKTRWQSADESLDSPPPLPPQPPSSSVSSLPLPHSLDSHPSPERKQPQQQHPKQEQPKLEPEPEQSKETSSEREQGRSPSTTTPASLRAPRPINLTELRARFMAGDYIPPPGSYLNPAAICDTPSEHGAAAVAATGMAPPETSVKPKNSRSTPNSKRARNKDGKITQRQQEEGTPASAGGATAVGETATEATVAAAPAQAAEGAPVEPCNLSSLSSSSPSVAEPATEMAVVPAVPAQDPNVPSGKTLTFEYEPLLDWDLLHEDLKGMGKRLVDAANHEGERAAAAATAGAAMTRRSKREGLSKQETEKEAVNIERGIEELVYQAERWLTKVDIAVDAARARYKEEVSF